MKLGTILWRGGLVLAAAACAGQYWLVQRTHEAVERLQARLVPQGDLHYRRLWPFPWGAGRAWGLSFRPEGGLQMTLQLPTGMTVTAAELRVHELRFDDNGHLARLRGRLIDVRVPVPERRAPASYSADPSRIPSPTLFDLGYTDLRFDLDFDMLYVASSGLASVRFDAAGPGIGHAVINAQLEGSPQVFARAPDQILVRKVELEFVDDALITRFKDVSAARARLNRADWEAAMAGYLQRRAAAEQWKWDEATAAAARGAIRESAYLRFTIDPPGDIVLRNIRLYPVGDWPVLLGFSVAGGSVPPD